MVDFSKTVGNIPTLPALAIGTDFALLSGIFEYSYRPKISSYLLPALTREVKLCTLLNISRYSYSAQIQIHLPPNRKITLCIPFMHFAIFLQILDFDSSLLPSLIGRSDCGYVFCILEYFYRSQILIHLLIVLMTLLHFAALLQITNLISSPAKSRRGRLCTLFIHFVILPWLSQLDSSLASSNR